jgi:5S rRNA maturation endonuclease (ribonuclease M5)
MLMMEQQKSTPNIFDVANDNILDILRELNIEVEETSKGLRGVCPIHKGDNPSAFHCILGEEFFAWRCYSHNCHQKYKGDILGLISGVLNHTRKQAFDWLRKFLHIDTITMAQSDVVKERKRHASKIKTLNRFANITGNKAIMNRKRLRELITIPADYYIKRGYSEYILNRYDIGYNFKTNRVTVPFYDDEYKYVIGFSNRSLYEKCDKCKFHHDPNEQCPEKNKSKWVNNAEFIKTNQLYNYWFAKDFLKKQRLAILVEGPGDIWKLEEAGFHNAVALCGTTISPTQEFKLLNGGVMAILILMDKDKAGENAELTLNEQLGHAFTICHHKLTYKDAGDTPITVLQNELNPLIEPLLKIYGI